MTMVIPEVHDALARAIATRSTQRRSMRPRRLGLLALAATVITGSALAATGVWHPILGDDHRGHPRAAHTNIPGNQSAALGVLRRPQTVRDRGPEVRAVLRMLTGGEINGVHTDGIRLLRQRSDGVTILVPTERVGRHDKGYRSSIRRRVLCVLTGVRVTIPGHKRLSGVAGQNCGTLTQLRTTGIAGATGSRRGFIYNALVPDGVASVVIPLHHRSLTVAVHDNLYEANTGTELPPAWSVRWLNADGHTINHRGNDPHAHPRPPTNNDPTGTRTVTATTP